MKTVKETKSRPIIYSTPMVRSIIADRKTQTRRVVKKNPEICSLVDGAWRDAKADLWRNTVQYARDCCPYGKVGDHLWVKETFCEYGGKVLYRADYDQFTPISDGIGGPWKSSRFMPRKYSRITLEITSVRVERLHAISEEDAIAEGSQCAGVPASLTNRGAFSKLWDKLNAKRLYPFESNPFVWVISFKRLIEK